MFGLGWVELLIIAGAAMLVFGPVAGPKLLDAVKRVAKVKQDLTGGSALDKLMKVDEALGSLADSDDAPPDDTEVPEEPHG